MKIILCIMMAGILFGCSSGDNSAAPVPQKKDTSKTVKLYVDMENEEKLQKAADMGYQGWRNSSTDVAHAALINAGANVNITDCNLLSEGDDEAVVAAVTKKGSYRIMCKRLVRSGGIWTATEIEITESADDSAADDVHEHMNHDEHRH